MTWIKTCDWLHVFAVGKLTETVVLYVFPSIIYTHLFLFKIKKNDSQGGSQVGSQGGSLLARSFDLARPGLAPPLPVSYVKHLGSVGEIAILEWNNLCVIVTRTWAIRLIILLSSCARPLIHICDFFSGHQSAFTAWQQLSLTLKSSSHRHMNSHHVNTAHDVTDCCVLTRLSTTRTTAHKMRTHPLRHITPCPKDSPVL